MFLMILMISGARKESLEIDRIPLARATFKEMLLYHNVFDRFLLSPEINKNLVFSYSF